MRVSSRSLLGLPLILVVGVSVALAQRPAAEPADEPVPELDVTISLGIAPPGSTELLGRVTPGSLFATVRVQEPGGHRVYLRPVSIALAPDGSEQVTKQAAGLTFNIKVSSSSRAKLVRADVVISRGTRVVGRHSTSAFL